MISSFNVDDRSIVETILFVLDSELRKRGIDKQYLNEVKVHKIIYNLADRLDLNITRSWYMRGCYIWCNEPIKDFLNSLVFTPKNIAESHIRSISETINEVIEDLNPFRFKTSEFLRKLYEKYAPPEFRDLYLANLDFKEDFKSFLNQLHPDQRLFFVDVDSTNVSSSISKLHMAITKAIEDSRILDLFIEYTSLLEKISIGLEEKSQKENVCIEFVNFAKEIFEKYDNEVWRLPAIEIAKKTLKGARYKDIHQNLSSMFNTTIHNVSTFLKIYERKVNELRLNPSEEFLLKKILPTPSAKAYLRALRDL